MNRVYIKTYGCQMNERDSEAVAALLHARGYRIVQNEDDCDIMLLNTCSVRDLAEQKAIGKAGYMAARKKRQPQFILGILGCMAQNRGAALLDQLPDVDLIVGTQKFHQVPGYLDNLRAARAAGVPVGDTIVDIAEEAGSQNTIRDHVLDGARRSPPLSPSSRAATWIAPSASCRRRAATSARGRWTTSWPNAAPWSERGVTGNHPARPDRHQLRPACGRSSLRTPAARRLSCNCSSASTRSTAWRASVSPRPHPRGFTQDLVEAYGRLPKLCEYVHLPLQSGSNRILRAMNRPYTRERYLEIVEALRARAARHVFFDRCHRGVSRRDRGGLRADAWSCSRP